MGRPTWLNFMLALNAVGLIATAVICGGFGYKLAAKYGRVRHFAETFPSNPVALANAYNLVSATAGDFFLGSDSGTIAYFFANQFAADFLGLANNATVLADAAFAEFRNSTTPTYVPCSNATRGQRVDCPSGVDRHCPWDNSSQYVTCDDVPGEYVMTGASAVKAAVKPVASHWRNVGVPVDERAAAFSATVLRMDKLVDWVGAQTRVADWKRVGAACQQFTSQMRAIDWRGSFINGNAVFTPWNGNEGVHTVARAADNICRRLAAM